MIQAHPTKNGTGIAIFGDYGDLTALYQSVHEVANSLDEDSIQLNGQHKILMNFAYDIRKAYSGFRLTDKIHYEGDHEKELFYYGFNVLWTDILIFISTLRHNAGYIQTDKLLQANLYMLEYVVEKALFEYDAEGASMIKDLIGQRINITNKYAFIIFQKLNIDFVNQKSGKKRFRNIPNLIEGYFSEWRQEYKDLINLVEVSAIKENCDILDLSFDDFPEIKW